MPVSQYCSSPARQLGRYGGVHKTADAAMSPSLNFLDGAADRDDAADDFMPRDAGVDRRHDLLPLVAHLMQI